MNRARVDSKNPSYPQDQAAGEQPGLSAVVLHYNRPWCLEIAAASLRRALDRSALPHEIILADDGSDPELRSLYHRLPLDQVFVQPQRVYDGERSSVYDTILSAYRLARYPYVLFMEDDFWILPQGFEDHGKNHVAGLLARPDFDARHDPLWGAVALLEQHPAAHFVELARGYRNPRYRCRPETQISACGVRFRAKSQAQTPRFYTCAWPHVVRAGEARSVPMPLGIACWSGESMLDAARRRAFGSGDWVFNPEWCYFAHVNIFTWREIYGRAGAANPMQWTDVDVDADLPFQFQPVRGFNSLLLDGYKKGRVRNDLDAYFATSPMAYVYRQFYRSVLT